MTSYTRRGFTLIELMVVMSIISMLASVVLVSLNGARERGKNARIQEDVFQLRNKIEESWDGTSYSQLPSSTFGSETNVVYLEPPYVSSEVLTISNDIIRINGGLYGGDSQSDGGCKVYCVITNYLSSGAMCVGPSVNGLTIFTDITSGGTCTPATIPHATKYAIYGAYGPAVGSSGYFCLDQAGNSIERRSGGIPGIPGPGITCN